MKLLVIAKNYQPYVSLQGIYYLLSELAQITELTIWHEKGNKIQTILNRMKVRPDFILIWEYFENETSAVTGLADLTIPFAVAMHDLHWDVEFRTRLIQREKIQHIMSIYRDAFKALYPKFKDKMLWVPHHANTKIFKDYGLPKNIDYLLMGEVDRYYPLRQKILNTMKGNPGFFYHPHPGYGELTGDKNIFVREKYAREINRAKIFFTSDSILQYPVAKYFEVLACKTLLLAPTFPEIEDLGFVPGVHFVAIDENNFVEKAEYYLIHAKERLEIAERGYEMVRTRHSTARRAADLVAMIEDILRVSGKG